MLTTIHINAVLAIFNLIPVPPLDGSKILVGVLPPAQAIAYARLQPYGVVILLLLILTQTSRFLLDAPINWLIQQAIGRVI
jgi:Zn-dependent protease